MKVAAACLLALAGCYTSSTKPAQPLSNEVRAPSQWQISEAGFSSVTASTPATLEGLRSALPGLRVETEDLGSSSGLVFDVYDGTDKLGYIVPDDDVTVDDDSVRHYAKTIFAVFDTSPRITVEGKAWRVGGTVGDASEIISCECWGQGEVTACWTHFAHILLIYEQRCDGPSGTTMVDKPISRIMWKREPEAPRPVVE